ncbi:hypothetical protein PFISCL1PPCAC_8396, partial [Pristionchus fissidentatus]
VLNLVKAYIKSDNNATQPDKLDELVEEALELERDIAIIYSGTDAERRQYKRQWNEVKKEKLPKTVDWDSYFALAPMEAQEWFAKKKIILNEKDYTNKLFDAGLKNRDSTVVNYLFIRLLLANSGFIQCANLPCLEAQRALAQKKVPEHTGRSRLPKYRRLPSFAVWSTN